MIPAQSVASSLPPVPDSFQTRILESLKEFSDAELDRVTSDAEIYFDRRWLRLLEALDLPALLKGEVSLRFAAVTGGGELWALCPFLVTRSETIVTQYALEKLFFTSWKDTLSRLNPESASWARWAIGFAESYRRMARALRTGSEGWVLAVSPLSVRGRIACRDLPEETRQRVLAQALEAVKDVARAEGLPVGFYGLEEGNPLRGALEASGFLKVFYSYDNVIDLSGRPQRLEEHLETLPGKMRRNIKYEMRRVEKQGYRFEVRRDFAPVAEQLERFYSATYSKYGDDYFRHPASFWTALAQHLGPHAEAILAYRGEELVGFSALLHKGSEMVVFRMGRPATPAGEAPPVYFSLILYEATKRALALGIKRIWLGQGAWGVKQRRGASSCALHNYFWFPTLRSRLVLGSFISAFGRISQAQLAHIVKLPQEGAET